MTQFDSTVSFGRVVGRLQLAVGDTTDDVDHNPDAAPAVGTVTFTPSVARLLNPGATIPSSIWAQPIICSIDSEGYICDPTGVRGVNLIATDDTDLEPTDWTYDVLVALTGNKQTFTNFAITVPAGEEIDLAQVMPVAPSKGVSSYTPSIVEAAVSAASDALSTYESIEEFMEEVGGGSDTEFSAALQARIEDYVDEAIAVHTPGKELAYAERTTSVTSTSQNISGAAITGFSITVVGTGNPVDIELSCGPVSHSVANTVVSAAIIANGTLDSNLIVGARQSPSTTLGSGPTLVAKRRLILTAGQSYTFTVRVFAYGVAGTSAIYATNGAGGSLMTLTATAR